MLVESGTQQLGDTILSEFFKVENYYEVRDASGSSRVYGFSDTISCDINMTITDQCSTFTKKRCLDTGGVCGWNKNGLCERGFVSEKSKVGVIVGASVGCAVVLIVVVIVIVLVVTRKQKKADLKNTEMFQEMSDMDTL